MPLIIILIHIILLECLNKPGNSMFHKTIAYVMHVKFAYVFVLDRNFEILIL